MSISRIHRLYYESNYDALFSELVKLSKTIGLRRALKVLEKMVIEKRLSWIQKNLDKFKLSEDIVWDGFRIFYNEYLGLQLGKDGVIVYRDNRKIISRWWNYCPVLEACKRYGLDTRVVCKVAYHKPVELFLRKISRRLRFNRNYDNIRPYAPHCEEIIFLA